MQHWLIYDLKKWGIDNLPLWLADVDNLIIKGIHNSFYITKYRNEEYTQLSVFVELGSRWC